MSFPVIMTAEELRRINYPDKCTELVRGRLVVREPAGYRHGRIVARFAKVLTDQVANDNTTALLRRFRLRWGTTGKRPHGSWSEYKNCATEPTTRP